MKAFLSVTSALLLGLSYGCANDDDDEDVPERTQTGDPSTASSGAASAGNSIAECVQACVKDAADCAAACTGGGGDCSATCDTTFASCEQQCEQIGD